jgi:hypothetical protein
MTPQARKYSNGDVYYSIVVRDETTGVRSRLPLSAHPPFATYEAALAWCKSQDAYKASRKAYVEKKLAWKTQYYQFNTLLTDYVAWQKTKAPNSWETNRFYLEHFQQCKYLVMPHVAADPP